MKPFRSEKATDIVILCKFILCRIENKSLVGYDFKGNFSRIKKRISSPQFSIDGMVLLDILEPTSPMTFFLALKQYVARINSTAQSCPMDEAIVKLTFLLFQKTLSCSIDDTFTQLYNLIQSEMQLIKKDNLEQQIMVMAELCRNNAFYDSMKKIITQLVKNNQQFRVQLKHSIKQIEKKITKTASMRHTTCQAIVLIALFTYLRLYEAYPKKNKRALRAIAQSLFYCIEEAPAVAMDEKVTSFTVIKTLYAYGRITRIPTQAVVEMLSGLHLLQTIILFEKIHVLEAKIDTIPWLGIMHPSNSEYHIIINKRTGQRSTRSILVHELAHVAQYIAPSQWQAVNVNIFFSEINCFIKKLKPKTRKLFRHIQNLKSNPAYYQRHYAAEIHAELYAIFSCKKPIFLKFFKKECPFTIKWFDRTNERVLRRVIRKVPLDQRASSPLFDKRSPSPLAVFKENKKKIKKRLSTAGLLPKPLTASNR